MPAAATRGHTQDGRDRVTQSGGAVIGYDGRSDLNSDGVNTYAHDTYNHLFAFNSTATLRGDPLDRLMAVTDLANGVATTDSRWFRYYRSEIAAIYVANQSGNSVAVQTITVTHCATHRKMSYCNYLDGLSHC